MGVAKRTRKFAATKRIIGTRDGRLKANQKKEEELRKKKEEASVIRVPAPPTQLFFNANTALGPPYSILVDTNFLALSIRAKLDLLPKLMDLLFAKCKILITDCVMAELEKLGPRYRLALKVARDPRWKRLQCDHKVYADDCIVDRVTKHRIYCVGTNDRKLKQTLRKIPGCPLISVGRGKYVIERLPDQI